MTVSYVVGDTRDVTAHIPDDSVDLILGSVPFFRQREYLPADHPAKPLELGSEPTAAEFIDAMLGYTAGWRRVLAPHGSIAVEVGDKSAGSGGAGGDYNDGGLREGQPRFGSIRGDEVLAKSVYLTPELYRVALAYGHHPLTGDKSPAGQWIIRNTVAWCKPNPSPGAEGDKWRRAKTDIVVACTSPKRWWDEIATRKPSSENSSTTSPLLDWWNIPKGSYPGAHFATWPETVASPFIEAMCPRRVCRTCGTPSRREVESQDGPSVIRGDVGAKRRQTMDGGPLGAYTGQVITTTGWTTCGCPGADGVRHDGYHTGPAWRPGLVLDPFCGSGTTLAVADGHSRDAIGIDLDERNVELARGRMGWWMNEVKPHELAGLFEVTDGNP